MKDRENMRGVGTGGVDTGFVALGHAKVAFLGVVQGITELLPISSSAHMRVVPALLGWPHPGSAFSAAMRLAALAAILSYFWRDVRELTAGSAGALVYRRFDDRHLRLSLYIVPPTVPIVLAGAVLSPLLNNCASPLRGVAVMGWACVAIAVLLALTELFARHRREGGGVRVIDALVVGIAQAGALIPGV